MDPDRAALLEELSRLKARVRELEEGREREAALLRLVCDNVPDLIWAKDVDKRYIFANRAICEKLLGAADTAEPVGRNDLFFAQRQRSLRAGDPAWHTFGEICQDSDQVVLDSQEAGRFDEFGNVRGQYLHLDVHKAPLRDEQGNLFGTVGCGRDVTRERLTEEELRRSEARFKTIYNNTDISIWQEDFSQVKAAVDRLRTEGVTDFRGYFAGHPEFVQRLARTIRVLDVNDATLPLYGASSKEQLLGHLDRVLVPETLPVLEDFMLAIAEGRSRFEHETLNRTLDGRLLHILIRLFLPRDPEEYGSLLLCILDVTAHKRLEEEQRRSQKLESLGVLAGGLAHDFNNLLMGIMGSISLARMYLEQGDPGLPAPTVPLGHAEKACERARALTQQLLTFARGGAPVKKALDVRELLTQAVNFCLSGSNVSCQFSLAGNLWNIEADEQQLTQVVGNIVLNAVEAMPEGGVLEVSAENRRLPEGEPSGLPSGRVVEILIRDHGVGISSDHLHRVFDPYFSGKKGGRGLGLAIVYSVIVKHGGHVTVDSEVGTGTTVRVFLPAVESAAAVPAEAEPREAPGQGPILVMDDEEVVRTTTRAMLEVLGHPVETARDGTEMLARYREAMAAGRPFRLVIMDLTIPGGMGGLEALRELLALDSGARAIVSSGYSSDPVMADPGAYGFAGVIPKPYCLADLERILGQVPARQ
jgi:signal transduction histidine kinase/CheY-like chemotaxis protein